MAAAPAASAFGSDIKSTSASYSMAGVGAAIVVAAAAIAIALVVTTRMQIMRNGTAIATA